MKSVRVVGLAAVSISMLAAGVAEASYPAGVWVKARGVEFEPSAAAPMRIRIHGAAMMYDGSTTNRFWGYAEPARGVLYYECPAGQLATCQDEWKDIVANINAPLEVCVGLGDQSQPTGRLRRSEEPPGTADAYPIHMGILQGFTPCEMIGQLLSQQVDAGSGAGGTGAGGSGSGGTGQSGAPASTPEKAASEDRGCSIAAVPVSVPVSGIGLAALAALALLRRRRG
jgi:MYXO-CTERM domain-containing protein